MPLLAFDTSTDAMSVAVAGSHAGEPRIWQRSAAGGAQASTTLIPLILELMAGAGAGFGGAGRLGLAYGTEF